MKNFKWDNKYLYWGITAFFVIAGSVVFFMALTRIVEISKFFGNILSILTPVIYGFVIAYLLTPLVKLFENKMFYRAGQRVFSKNERRARSATRVFSIFMAYAIAWFLIILLLIFLLPELYNSLESLGNSLPSYFNNAIGFIRETLDSMPDIEVFAVNLLDNAGGYFTDWVQSSLLTNIDSLIVSVSSGVYGVLIALSNLLIGMVFSIYIVYNREVFAAQFKKILFSLLPKKTVKKILGGVQYISQSFGGFFIGQIMDSVIIGLICFIFLTAVDMPYTALVSIFVGITNIIPFFGPLIGAIPSALLILMESPVKCLIFVIFIIVLQQIDGNIITPKILSNTTGLNGFWVMFSIIVGGALFGTWGLLCGVPIFAIIYAGVKYLVAGRLKGKDLPVDTNSYFDIEKLSEDDS